MNNKTAIGLVIAIIIVALALFLFGRNVPQTVQIPLGTTTPAATGATTTAPAATTSASAPSMTLPTTISTQGGGTITQNAPVATHAPRVAAFDLASLTAHVPRPIITGTANVSAVALVLDDPSGVGIAGSDNINVTNGHWSFSAPQMLPPGTYTLHLIGGDKVIEAKLVVSY